ncbi:MAG TPA: hypothetical protein VGD24_10025 [Gallionella sp.]
MKQLYSTGANSPALLRKLIGFAVTTAVIVLALMFSLALLAVIVVVGLFALAYVGWKTRGLRRQMHEHNYEQSHEQYRGGAGHGEMRGEVIEGEAVRVTEPGTPR